MMKPPLTFNRPRTILTDTDEARAQAARTLKEILHDAIEYFGPKEVKRIANELTKGRKGNKPDEKRNALMLAEYDAQAAKGRVNHRIFARDFCKRHTEQSPEATKKQLERLLKARQQKAREKAKFEEKFGKKFQQQLKSRRGKSFLGTE